jgi:hypothetical protein
LPFLFFFGLKFLGTTQEEAARRQKLLDDNRAERAKRAERKLNKVNGVDRVAHSDDEERENTKVTARYFSILFNLNIL